MTKEESHTECLESIANSLEDIAKSLGVLSGRRDNVGGVPGPIEAIAMALGCGPDARTWPAIGDTLDSISASLAEISEKTPEGRK